MTIIRGFTPVEEHYLSELYLRSILEGRSDPTMAMVMRQVFRAELPVFPERIDGLEQILWWNSDTKVDPTVANSVILE